MSLRAFYRRSIPAQRRAQIRRAVTELPHRVRDFIPDVLGHLKPVKSAEQLPPPRLRRRVGRTSARTEFATVGDRCLQDIMQAIRDAGFEPDHFPSWLDFGCGSGRLSRNLGRQPFVKSLTGVDPDREAVAWCAGHLPGDYLTIDRTPRIAFSDSSFDAVVAISVFTHFDESAQRSWLGEVRRLLRPGGIFIASTHSEVLLYTRPDLSAGQHEALNSTGFLFAGGCGGFNDDSAFHTIDYLRATWGSHLSLRLHRAHGLAGFQDLSVWQRARGS